MTNFWPTFHERKSTGAFIDVISDSSLVTPFPLGPLHLKFLMQYLNSSITIKSLSPFSAASGKQ
jgi:hypothetical protein